MKATVKDSKMWKEQHVDNNKIKENKTEIIWTNFYKSISSLIEMKKKFTYKIELRNLI